MRDLILSGALPQGERLSELSVVERLGVSRTPVRMALVRLEEEGLLEAIPSGGFAVRAFSEADIDDAIEIRGALEGLAARFAAERGASRGRLAELKDCLAEIDDLAGLSEGSEESFSDYVRLNARFHALLHALSDSPALMRQIDRACALPFASPSGFVAAQARPAAIALHPDPRTGSASLYLPKRSKVARRSARCARARTCAARAAQPAFRIPEPIRARSGRRLGAHQTPGEIGAAMRTAIHWTPARLLRVRDVAKDIRLFEIAPEGGTRTNTPGSHINVALVIDDQTDSRSYSVVDADAEAYRIAVKRCADSRGGSRAMWSLPPGAPLTISEPHNNFVLDFDRAKTISLTAIRRHRDHAADRHGVGSRARRQGLSLRPCRTDARRGGFR